MQLPRSSGVLVHPTSIPGADGIGDLGPRAHELVDFLARARQGIWQVLPLGPAGPGDSPYAASSAFAGNPLLVSLEALGMPGGSGRPGRVDFERSRTEKRPRLRSAFQQFRTIPGNLDLLDAFREEHAGWLADYVLFTAIKEARSGAGWTQWPAPLARRDPAALAAFRDQHAEDLEFHEFVQYAFMSQWMALKAHAGSVGIRIMGDMPIFVAHDSADVWANPELFHLDESGEPTEVAGVPPDYFSPTGQLWGNPIYHWDRMAEQGYRWWIDRFRHLFRQTDLVRIDHFRGFAAYWSVPAGEHTAINGQWKPGPGAGLFDAVRAAIGDLPIVAEDLGTITPDVDALRTRLGFPGMKVLQFAFGDDALNPYLPHNHIQNCAIYTGTHDNDTTIGWFTSLGDHERHRVRAYLGVSGEDIAWDLIRAALVSVADTSIFPLQDVLGLGGEHRMNVPGLGAGNWNWRYSPEQLEPRIADRLADLTRLYGRADLPRRSS